jgi:hypothetical protein
VANAERERRASRVREQRLSIDEADQLRKAAIYIDRILKGTEPGDLPV